MVEEIADAGGEGGVGGGGEAAGGEIGAGVGAAEEAGGFVVGEGRFLGGLEGAEPNSDFLGGVFDLGNPSSRRTLADADKFVACSGSGGGGGGSFRLGFEFGGLNGR